MIGGAGVVAAIGDPSRFASAPDFMAYLGMVPSELSTDPKRCAGAITKAGDVHPSSGYSSGFAAGILASLARILLIEAAHAYRFPARIARHKPAAIDAAPEAVRDIAWKAQTRASAIGTEWQRASRGRLWPPRSHASWQDSSGPLPASPQIRR
jgi:transposase